MISKLFKNTLSVIFQIQIFSTTGFAELLYWSLWLCMTTKHWSQIRKISSCTFTKKEVKTKRHIVNQFHLSEVAIYAELPIQGLVLLYMTQYFSIFGSISPISLQIQCPMSILESLLMASCLHIARYIIINKKMNHTIWQCISIVMIIQLLLNFPDRLIVLTATGSISESSTLPLLDFSAHTT